MNVCVKDLLQWGQKELLCVSGDGAQKEARLLLMHILDADPIALSVKYQETVSFEKINRFKSAVAQRKHKQPVSQIVGWREFWGRRFKVTPDVLDPRPETEALIELALKGPVPSCVLDLGTGSGCILLTLLLEWSEVCGVGVEYSKKALAVAGANADKLCLTHRARLIHSNWFENVQGRFDLIVSNPPYISAEAMRTLDRGILDWEPHVALTSGGDGLASYRHIAQNVANYLNPNGMLLVEIGWDQSERVLDIFTAAGFGDCCCVKDITGKDRVVRVCKHAEA